MQSDRITVRNTGEGMADSIEQAAAAAAYRGLTGKNALHIRLLAEEMLGMVRQITGQTEASFWVESEEKSFQLHLVAHPIITDGIRKELLSVASSGKNSAAVGVMGKLRDIFERAFEATEPGGVMDYGSYYTQGMIFSGADSMAPMSFALNVSLAAEAVNWSMRQYKATVEQERAEDESAREEWDELEKSIIANLADEVTISIRGGEVEMIVFKNFN